MHTTDGVIYDDMSNAMSQLLPLVVSRNFANKAFQADKIAVSHLLQKAQKLRHINFAAEQRRYAASRSWSQS
jgi:hypothetical protein